MRPDTWIPRAENARGKVSGRCPDPARGEHPLKPPPAFPSASCSRTVLAVKGSLIFSTKDFPPPRTNRAPLTAPGRSENTVIRESGRNAKSKSSSRPGSCLPLVGPELHDKFGVDKTS